VALGLVGDQTAATSMFARYIDWYDSGGRSQREPTRGDFETRSADVGQARAQLKLDPAVGLPHWRLHVSMSRRPGQLRDRDHRASLSADVAYAGAVSDPDAALDLCLRYRDAFSARDVEPIVALVTPDFVFESVTAGERVQGIDAVRSHIAAIHSRRPDMRFVERDRASCPVRTTPSPNGRRTPRTLRQVSRSNGTEST
jgi:hypothetical protein